MPANLTSLCIFFAVHKRFLTMIVQAIWLNQVYDVEFVLLIFASVAYAEVIPL